MLRLQRVLFLKLNKAGTFPISPITRLLSTEGGKNTEGKKANPRAPHVSLEEIIDQWKDKSIEEHQKLATIPQKSWRTMFHQLFGVMGENLKSGKDVTVPSFGTFKVRKSAERKSRNPRTGEALTVPPKDRLRFKASSKFMEDKTEKKKVTKPRKAKAPSE